MGNVFAKEKLYDKDNQVGKQANLDGDLGRAGNSPMQ